MPPEQINDCISNCGGPVPALAIIMALMFVALIAYAANKQGLLK